MNRSRSLFALSALLVALALAPAAAVAQEDPPAPVRLVAVQVEPESPAVDTLCRLRVTIENGGQETVSQFGFGVEINGTELPVYANQLFMYPIPPGESLEIPLYNFWSTETSRPAPADGKLRIEVRLQEAEWMRIEMEDDVEVWTPLGPAGGLPSELSLTLDMAGGKGD